MSRKVLRSAGAVLVMALVSVVLPADLFGQQKKPRIAVLNFDSSHISTHHAQLTTNIINGMFEAELVKTTKFTVIERKRLEAVLKEQGLGLSGAVDQATAVKVGALLGVELVLVGDITKLGVKQVAGQGRLFGAGSKSSLEGGIDVRLVSTQTAQIVFAEKAEHADSSFKVNILGVSGGTDIDETKIDKVFRPCVGQLAQKMASQVDQIVGTMRGGTGLTAKIANVIGGKIYLTAGTTEGINVGDTFDVYRRGQEIRDPDTGAVLDVEMTLIGKIVVTEVKEKVSIATAQTGTGFQSGDIVKPPK